jgi:hypothetical protein
MSKWNWISLGATLTFFTVFVIMFSVGQQDVGAVFAALFGVSLMVTGLLACVDPSTFLFVAQRRKYNKIENEHFHEMAEQEVNQVLQEQGCLEKTYERDRQEMIHAKEKDMRGARDDLMKKLRVP